MDPLSAVGLASAIFNFLDFSWSLVTSAKEMHGSGRGTTKENARIGSIVSDLHDYSLELSLEDILGRLREIKNSKWQSLRTTWASVRKKSEIASIEARLDQYRAQNSSIKSQLDDIQGDVAKVSAVSANGLKVVREELVKHLTKLNSTTTKQTMHRLILQIGSTRALCTTKRQEWETWLRERHGVFHISGKAGSGKSTLMKLVSNDQGTAKMLEQWSGDRALVSAYFWNSDSELQISLRGLYRAILFLVLCQCPNLILQAFHDQWEKLSEPSAMSQSQSLEAILFRPQHIKAAFDVLMELPVQSDSSAFCFFIDGLDEYEAHAFDHKRLAAQLRDWAKASYIKLSVSSRPHAEFTDTFSPAQPIRLHELTAYDMHRPRDWQNSYNWNPWETRAALPVKPGHFPFCVHNGTWTIDRIVTNGWNYKEMVTI
ncbi:hypothetical protein B0T24DRAFT_702432 [Lasiosphaeria ovina]|uniref:Nephrocystin 3-like N-terminal domain-containing protein n=1 Tax=Lasiosphaeria ovina TaxID=92902 RepID=A0AAE0KBK6_9PEZI|nr:hypothetical protein B0T24DRAFT_702432 [Lasiosphaeria ovina]